MTWEVKWPEISFSSQQVCSDWTTHTWYPSVFFWHHLSSAFLLEPPYSRASAERGSFRSSLNTHHIGKGRVIWINTHIQIPCTWLVHKVHWSLNAIVKISVVVLETGLQTTQSVSVSTRSRTNQDSSFLPETINNYQLLFSKRIKPLDQAYYPHLI